VLFTAQHRVNRGDQLVARHEFEHVAPGARGQPAAHQVRIAVHRDQDDAGGGMPPDVITVFAAAAVQTSKIKMGTSITQTWPRHPVAIASQCLAMAQLAPGRFRIGLGPSHQPAVEGMYGVKYGEATYTEKWKPSRYSSSLA